jgi:hypothetical protein
MFFLAPIRILFFSLSFFSFIKANILHQQPFSSLLIYDTGWKIFPYNLRVFLLHLENIFEECDQVETKLLKNFRNKVSPVLRCSEKLWRSIIFAFRYRVDYNIQRDRRSILSTKLCTVRLLNIPTKGRYIFIIASYNVFFEFSAKSFPFPSTLDSLKSFWKLLILIETASYVPRLEWARNSSGCKYFWSLLKSLDSK